MEPFRPFVDDLVLKIVEEHGIPVEITKEVKAELLRIPALPVIDNGGTHPIMVMVAKTTSSLALCFSGERTQIDFPIFDDQF